jgi:hypothetical protein
MHGQFPLLIESKNRLSYTNGIIDQYRTFKKKQCLLMSYGFPQAQNICTCSLTADPTYTDLINDDTIDCFVGLSF